MGDDRELLPVEQLPPALQMPTAATRMAAVNGRGGPIDDTLATSGITTVAAVPLPESLGLLWAGSVGPSPFTDAQALALESLGRRVVERSRVPESEDLLMERMERLEALADVLPHLARALDLREVFERLSEVASHVLPHESAVVGINSDDRTWIVLQRPVKPTRDIKWGTSVRAAGLRALRT
jgi:hypothetical protein